MNELAVVMRAREFITRVSIDVMPVDLKDYVNAAGAKLEVRWNMKDDEAGYTIPLPDHYLICVNGTQREERQRFTVLHEIAHIILELPSSHSEGLDEDSLGSYQRKSPEETLCDIFAAEFAPRALI